MVKTASKNEHGNVVRVREPVNVLQQRSCGRPAPAGGSTYPARRCSTSISRTPDKLVQPPYCGSTCRPLFIQYCAVHPLRPRHSCSKHVRIIIDNATCCSAQIVHSHRPWREPPNSDSRTPGDPEVGRAGSNGRVAYVETKLLAGRSFEDFNNLNRQAAGSAAARSPTKAKGSARIARCRLPGPLVPLPRVAAGLRVAQSIINLQKSFWGQEPLQCRAASSRSLSTSTPPNMLTAQGHDDRPAG